MKPTNPMFAKRLISVIMEASFAILLLCCSGARAAEVLLIDPAVSSFSSQNPYGLDRAAVHTVDDSGLTVGPSGILGAADSTVDSYGEGQMWTTAGSTGATPDLNPFITYDLGEVYTLQTTRIWNYNDEGPDPQFGASSILLSTSVDGTNFTTFGIINPAEAGNPPLAAQDFVTGVAGVRYVQMQILTNYDSPPAIFWSSITGTNQPGADGRYLTGLSKVRFVVAAGPVLNQGVALGGGHFMLTFSGQNAENYSVLTSTNVALPLTNWTILTSGVFGVGSVSYTDTTATNRTQFYIIRSP
jgi:hypothetical protein